MKNNKHWSKVQLLYDVVSNPNIILKGKHSYYSDAYDEGFEASVVRYLHGDEVSSQWQAKWHIDQLIIGNYVCIGAEVVILMGGNHTHRDDWFCLYPFMDMIEESYLGKGDTCIDDGAWLGMRAMVMPGVHIGEGAIIAANSVVTKDVPAYSVVGGSPATHIRYRFSQDVIKRLLALKMYDWCESKLMKLRPFICNSDILALEQASKAYKG
ncbi:CatB-related O-acetyltransferase [uncultured Shewanella sp.]|uniref:CatB-related O-acetyltransferase n=1 Tax=uncultured Shewanella sp. TaxID=173975 RepID=UPI00261F376A|nr:CatB-related O-acetyltransferase [uncultured Shewanella sp.]